MDARTHKWGNGLDLWLQRASVAAMVALGVGLTCAGLLLYAR